MAKVLIPTALRSFTDGEKELDAAGKTAGEIIASIADAHPEIRQHLYDEGGKLRSYVNVYIGDENIRNIGGLDAPVTEGETISLVPAIAGGTL